MATDYTLFPPVGQNDNYSCWAACLSWWLTAMGKPPESQNDIIHDFNALAASDGSITPDIFRTIAADPKFNMQVASFDINGMQQMRDVGLLPITLAPNIIVWNKFLTGPGVIGMHMNVIFNQRDGGSGAIVTCMEPFFPDPGADGQRTGQFVDRPITFFLDTSPIYFGVNN